MTDPLHVIDLKKAQPVEKPDGLLTKLGMRVAHDYAREWVNLGQRNLVLERKHPSLAGLFYDIRIDVTLAREHALPLEA